MGDFKKLTVWRRSHELAIASYYATTGFPFAERFGLCAQIRRSASSISANIAESAGRWEARDQVRFLRIALGSARELETQLLLARDVQLLKPEAWLALHGPTSDVQRMLSGLIRSRLRP